VGPTQQLVGQFRLAGGAISPFAASQRLCSRVIVMVIVSKLAE